MKPTFIDRPADYLMAQRESRDNVRYASAVHRMPQSKGEEAAGVVLAVVLGVLLACALMSWWASA